MTTLTIRRLDEAMEARLRALAARGGRSMDEEARRILEDVLAERDEPPGPGSRVHARVLAVSGGVDLRVPERFLPRPAPGSEDSAP